MTDFPKLISVDDHVIEPANVWQDRLPKQYLDVGPRVVQERGHMQFVGGVFSYEPADDGDLCDWWVYEDKKIPQTRLSAAVGFDRDDVKVVGITYEEMRRGCWDPKARLEDMDVNHTDAQMCFPSFPRFCGQTFKEAQDMELADLCVKAYNDWMVEEWSGGTGGRLIPLCLIPLWDPVAAADEVRRNAARGVRAVCFSEIPHHLGLPSIHTDHWDPFFAACNETGTVIFMHIGSGSLFLTSSPDAPPAVTATLDFVTTTMALSDWLFSGVLARHPSLRVCFPEGQIGWIPYVLDRADALWQKKIWAKAGERLPEPPSAYMKQIFACFYDDPAGLAARDRIGVSQIAFETDYPHQDSTWPDTRAFVARFADQLDDGELHQILRGNAAKLLGLEA